MSNTTKYILIGGAVLVVAYLLFSRSSGRLSTTARPPATTGGASYIDAAGRAAGGVAKLWEAIFGSDDEGTNAGDGYKPDIAYGEDGYIQ